MPVLLFALASRGILITIFQVFNLFITTIIFSLRCSSRRKVIACQINLSDMSRLSSKPQYRSGQTYDFNLHTVTRHEAEWIKIREI